MIAIIIDPTLSTSQMNAIHKFAPVFAIKVPIKLFANQHSDDIKISDLNTLPLITK